LIRGEADASSFPNGGIRTTFRARGYTIWDPTSPAFIRAGKNGSTLVIPAFFCSWTGDALDIKTPLVRSDDVLSKAAVELLHLIGHTEVEHVNSTLGPEQEFFVVDRTLFTSRPDLVFTGRTVLGAPAPKGQEMEDHYFGTMPPRILAFIQEVETELWKLGIPTKSRHNEVAPGQHEMAPIFELSNIAADHNMIMMELLREVASKHGLAALLHEKPFAGVNGSGKHNNWSMATNTGMNLLDPGDEPRDNLVFQVFLSIAIRAVDAHADLLRGAIATPGNDWRLGANEAPPAIMSVYLGSEVDKLIRSIMHQPDDVDGPLSPEHRPEESHNKHNDWDVKLADNVAPFRKDNTDRNRTSPFAFTGNKFEFRAVGSSQSVGQTCTILNTIMAESIRTFAKEVKELVGKSAGALSAKQAVRRVLKSTLKKHERVVYNGNGYSEEWVIEAAKRGLPNLRENVVAIEQFESPKNVELFDRLGVLSHKELHARVHVLYHHYCNSLKIEADVCYNMVTQSIIPAAQEQQRRMAESISALQKTLPSFKPTHQLKLLQDLSTGLEDLISLNYKLKEVIDGGKAFDSSDAHKWAYFYRDSVKPAIALVREKADLMESLVDDELWNLPKYSDLLFLK
jgi:glutamine synthetase